MKQAPGKGGPPPARCSDWNSAAARFAAMIAQWSETGKLRPAGEGCAVEKRAREPQSPAPVLCARPFAS
jgi:hypothetical protein